MWPSCATEREHLYDYCLQTKAGPQYSTNFRDTTCSFVMGERKRWMRIAKCRDKKRNRNSLHYKACRNQDCTEEKIAKWKHIFIQGAITKGVRLAVWKFWSTVCYMHHYNVLHVPRPTSRQSFSTRSDHRNDIKELPENIFSNFLLFLLILGQFCSQLIIVQFTLFL